MPFTTLWLAISCTASDPLEHPMVGTSPADFTLVDENTTSTSYGAEVSVAAHDGQGSAWYFGHAT